MSQKITRLDSRRPARIIGMNHRSVTGKVAIGGISIPFESSLERDFLIMLDFDPMVVDVFEQPVRITYESDEGRERFYTPDYLVGYDNGERVIYEVKYRANLKDEWSKLKPKFRAAIRYSKLNDMKFKIITDAEIRGTSYLANAKFLRTYRDQTPNFSIEEHLVRTLAILGETTPEKLLIAAYWTLENRMKAMASLWRLVAIRRVQVDLRGPLTMASSIWVTAGEGFV
ncbi:hypothetical protein JAMGFMIE_03880 [Rheinheimera sp. MM224]|nr:hypothetical protein JAMGFMIE_03880 [Rheinheimera sp. MM224]